MLERSASSRSLAGVAALRGSFYRAVPAQEPQPPIALPPYEVGGTDLGNMKADPVISFLINDQDRSYWARQILLARPIRKKGYHRFHTPDGRRCILAREGLWLMVKKGGAKS